MKKIIFVGNISSGKTTLSQVLLGEDLQYKKTQAVEVLGSSILDTPGEYLELVKYQRALMVSSVDADVIALVQSAIDEKKLFPPAYAASFAKPVIGIVTKIDVASEQEIAEAESALRLASVDTIFRVSSYSKMGVQELRTYLETSQKQPPKADDDVKEESAPDGTAQTHEKDK